MVESTPQQTAWVAAAVVSTVFLYLWSNSRRTGPLPPGPPSKPIIGSAHLFPKRLPSRVFAEWTKLYGPIIYLKVFTRKIIILNSVTDAEELLERRASTYSERPYLYMLYDLAGRKHSVFNIPTQSRRHKAYRKLLTSELNPRATASHAPLFEAEAKLLLQRLQRTPENFFRLIRLNAGAIIMKLAYGYNVQEDKDVFITTIEKVFAINTKAIGFWLADYYPILRYLPKWLAPFKRRGAEFKAQMDVMSNLPHEWVRTRMAEKDYEDCFTTRNLLDMQKEGGTFSEEDEDIVRSVAAGLYAGGADTVASALTTFMWSMAVYPEAQKRAQEEIDSIIGRDRLPNSSDWHSGKFPYMTALIKEVLRTGPPVPTAIPHATKEDDMYKGYFIPKGTMIVPNVWAMMHDETVFPEPFDFKPERHLADNTSEPTVDPFRFVFGFGRRVCPGAHWAQTQLFVNTASILSAFTITCRLDGDGKTIRPAYEWTSGTTSHIEPFDIVITPRADSHSLINGQA